MGRSEKVVDIEEVRKEKNKKQEEEKRKEALKKILEDASKLDW